MEVITHRDENWVKGFFLFVSHEEQEAPTYSIDDLMVHPCGMKSEPFHFHEGKKHHRHLLYVFIMHGYAWKFHLSQFGGTSSRVFSFCTRTNIADELPVWWYDFHNLIFILYNDNFLLFLLMVGRRQIKPWDPGILGNDKFPKGTKKFGSLQRSQWDPRIILSYLK